jgi:hypothetical protein
MTNIQIGDGFYTFKPSSNNAMTDTGTSMILGYYKEVQVIIKKVCQVINDMDLPAKCSTIGYGHYKIDNCSKDMQDKFPDIKIQLDSYPYHIRGRAYTQLSTVFIPSIEDILNRVKGKKVKPPPPQ